MYSIDAAYSAIDVTRLCVCLRVCLYVSHTDAELIETPFGDRFVWVKETMSTTRRQISPPSAQRWGCGPQN